MGLRSLTLTVAPGLRSGALLPRSLRNGSAATGVAPALLRPRYYLSLPASAENGWRIGGARLARTGATSAQRRVATAAVAAAAVAGGGGMMALLGVCPGVPASCDWVSEFKEDLQAELTEAEELAATLVKHEKMRNAWAPWPLLIAGLAGPATFLANHSVVALSPAGRATSPCSRSATAAAVIGTVCLTAFLQWSVSYR
jgi:hypothetical protein